MTNTTQPRAWYGTDTVGVWVPLESFAGYGEADVLAYVRERLGIEDDGVWGPLEGAPDAYLREGHLLPTLFTEWLMAEPEEQDAMLAWATVTGGDVAVCTRADSILP